MNPTIYLAHDDDDDDDDVLACCASIHRGTECRLGVEDLVFRARLRGLRPRNIISTGPSVVSRVQVVSLPARQTWDHQRVQTLQRVQVTRYSCLGAYESVLVWILKVVFAYVDP